MQRRRNVRDILLEAGIALSSERSLEGLLQRIVELAAEITGARYGALGILGPEGRVIELVTAGLSDEERAAIGPLPTGRGIVGALITGARPLRLRRISDDPRAAGFPPHHPRMTSFLGVPVTAGGRAFGNLYLTNKVGAEEFTAQDERNLLILAAQAGVAIANARLLRELRRRAERMTALGQITDAIAQRRSVDDALELIAASARRLAAADMATIAAPDASGDEMVLRAAAGAGVLELRGRRFPAEGSISKLAMVTREAVRLEDAAADRRVFQPVVRLGDMGPALFVPLVGAEESLGTLLVARRHGGRGFNDEDAAVLKSFAAQAAVAVEYGRAREAQERIALMEERERIAKELHDGIIQSLFAVGMSLQATALGVADEQTSGRIENAVGDLDGIIQDLRAYIFGLRPPILADRSLDGALRELVDEFGSRSATVAVADIDPAVATGLAAAAPDLVQFVREALSNVVRHANAATVRVSLHRGDPGIVLEIDDDGVGFDAAGPPSGTGLPNLRARAEALGGELEIDSSSSRGTTVRLVLPGAGAAPRAVQTG